MQPATFHLLLISGSILLSIGAALPTVPDVLNSVESSAFSGSGLVNLQNGQSVAAQSTTPAPESDSKHHAVIIFACIGGTICAVIGILIIVGFIKKQREPARYRDLNEDARFNFTETDRAVDRGELNDRGQLADRPQFKTSRSLVVSNE